MGRTSATVLLLVLLCLGAVVVVQGAEIRLPGNHVGYEPVQPVAFSHALHAGDLRIACAYCHTGTERSRHAGLPPTQICLNCHAFVPARLADVRAEEARATAAGEPPRPVVSPEIQKLYRALGLDDAAKPVPGKAPTSLPWVRVHNLPDYVRFDHRPHVAAGVECAECHGPVETMERVRQVSDLSMGWCVSCHRAAEARARPDGRRAQASTDCSACHH